MPTTQEPKPAVSWYEEFKAEALSRMDADIAVLSDETRSNSTDVLRDKIAMLRLRQLIASFDPNRPYSVRPAGAEKALEFVTMDLKPKEVAWLKANATMQHVQGENMFVLCASTRNRIKFMDTVKEQKLYGDLVRVLLDMWPDKENDERWIWIWDTTV